MVRQAMTFEWQALLSCEQGRSCLTAVIPAKAGIHLRFLHQSNMDSRFRGNDSHEDWSLCVASSAA